MKKLLLLSGILSVHFFVFSQSTPCSITGFASPAHISCGQEVTLSAFGNGAGDIAFQEDFNSGSPTGWQFTQTVTIANNTCGRPSPDGSNFMWMGDASVNPRDMTTVPFDLTLGGTICFYMRYAIQGQASPCEGPDEPQEGVYLQYSTDNGATWVTIEYWHPQGGNNSQLTNWNQYCAVIPAGAMTTNTMIRWHQDNVSGAEYDHWGIDDVAITLNDPNFQITWQHDGYSYGYGSSGGEHPTTVLPQTTTTYTVTISDGTTTCTDNVEVVVVDPTIVIDIAPVPDICPGECVTINADAYWEVEAPGPKTFVNDVTESISSGAGVGATFTIPITTSGINLANIGPNDILEVCITGMDYFGFSFPTPLHVGAFRITLECPGGASIELVPSGVTASTFILPGYVNTCFTMTATANIATGTAPYTGNFAPSEPFSDLAGCPANGTWNMKLTSTQFMLVGEGNFNGWSITFDDPGKRDPVTYSWSPTTNMTNSNTLTPEVCLNAPGSYTLTAENAPGCRPHSETVNINISNTCCDLQIDNVTTMQPSCTGGNGSIELTVSGQIAGLRFSIDGGATFQASPVFSGLNAGTYQIQAIDDNDCPVYRNVTLAADAPSIDNISVVDAACGTNDGTITVTVSGGSGTYGYSIDGGATVQLTNVFSGLAAGNYTITVADNAGCVTTQTANVNNAGAPVISNVSVQDITCNNSVGRITITATGGGAIQYSIDNGVTFQSSGIFTGVAAGTYQIVVSENGCEATRTTTVNSSSSLIVNTTVIDDNCGTSCAGRINVTISGGTPPYACNWNHTTATLPILSSVCGGTYTATVVDASGCSASVTATVGGQAGATADFNLYPTEVTLYEGLAQLTNTSQGADSYLWNLGMDSISTATSPTFDFSVLGVGVHQICLTASSVGGCSDKNCKTIVVKDDMPIYVPNAFTPNIDDINPEFKPAMREITGFQEYEWSIFNRWGEVIYTTESLAQGWDGTYNGKPVAQGLYAWRLRVKFYTSTAQVYMGHVSLIR